MLFIYKVRTIDGLRTKYMTVTGTDVANARENFAKIYPKLRCLDIRLHTSVGAQKSKR